MSNTVGFIYYFVLLTLGLIVLDIAFLRFCNKQFDKGEPLVTSIQEAIRRAGEWVSSLKISLPKPPLRITPPAEQQPVEPGEKLPVAESAASTGENGFSLSQTPAPENGTPAAGEKTVHVQISVDIPEGTIVNITIQAVNGEGKAQIWREALGNQSIPGKPPQKQAERSALAPIRSIGQFFQNLWERLNAPEKWKSPNLQRNLFIAAIAIYFLAVSIGIDRFPIYFFTDETVHTNLAADLWNRGMQGPDGEFLPTYFGIDPTFALNSVSVYLQVIPYALFGKSIVVTRMVSALITLLGAILVGLLLKRVFKVKSYWLGVLLLITSPAWFLHARTAFEYMEVASFFAAMLYFYNRYRQGEDKYLYATVFAAALVFYTHGLGQVLAGLTGLLLFLSDIRYHLQPERRRTLLWALGLVILLFLPYLRYNIGHSTVISDQIRQRGSYWTNDNFSLLEKLGKMLVEYLSGLNPFFWFFPNKIDLQRHEMSGYGNLLWPLLPFAAWGLIRTIRNFRLPEYRSVLIALLVAPIPASIVAIGTPRVLWMIVPWVILIALGLDAALQWLETLKNIKINVITSGLFLLLTFTSVYMLRDALVNGPTWFSDYGLYGMQYGAKQVFRDTVVPWLRADPAARFIISPSWANGTDQFAMFFVPPELSDRIRFGTPNDLMNEPELLTPDVIFVLTADEFGNFSQDAKFRNLDVLQIIPYPNGEPGFYLLKLQFADNIDEIIAAEHDANRKPVEDTVEINGQIYRILHSPLGGQLKDIFDDNPRTISRVIEADPFMFDIYPPEPIDTHSVVVQTGSLSNFTITVKLYAPGATEPVTYSQTFTGLPPDPLVTMDFENGPEKSERIYLEILDNTTGETSQIHVRTIQFK